MATKHHQLLLKMKTGQTRTHLHQDRRQHTKNNILHSLVQDKSRIKWCLWMINTLNTQARHFSSQSTREVVQMQHRNTTLISV